LAPLRRRISTAEGAIKRLNDELARLDAALAEPGLYARDPKKAASLARQRAHACAELATAEEDWLAASAAYEQATEVGSQ
jgi:ATP-binding cassette subfamily F protein 3